MGDRFKSNLIRAGALLATACATGATAKPGTAVTPRGNAAATTAAVPDDCPPTIAAAQALLARQGRLPGNSGDQYPQRFRPDGLTILGGTPSAVTVANAPGVLWGFSYELPGSYEINYRRAFAAAYRTGGGFTYHCPANSQCLWSADGYGPNGVQPQHVTGNLLQVGLSGRYESPGYTLSCLYVNRRPPPR